MLLRPHQRIQPTPRFCSRNEFMSPKIAGGIVIDGRHVADTVQCVHCQKHWIPQRGSGRIRGWCIYCNGLICGALKCRVHIPYGTKMEYREGLVHGSFNTVRRILNRYPQIKLFKTKKRKIETKRFEELKIPWI